MSYIAVKPVKFDRLYAIGEEIPVTVVDNSRAKDLIKMGLIDGDVPVIPVIEVSAETVTVEEELKQEIAEEDANKSVIYDRTSLSKLKKDELVDIASGLIGQDINADGETRNSLIDLIIAAQEMSV
jgi:hypothetical protein